ncbi:MAG: hypothetical protein ACOCVP_07815 [Wenzhouxiangella sp.]
MILKPARLAVQALTAVALLYALAACSEAPPPAETPPTETMPMAKPPLDQANTGPVERFAVNDLARRLDLAPARIEVVSALAVTWPSGALGCPAPDGMYTQALVEGFQVVLAAEGEEYHYHAGATGEPFLCPEERRQAPVGAGRARF